MKKKIILIFVLIFSVTICTFPRKPVIKKRIMKAKHLKLLEPENNWKFEETPVSVHFKWVHPGNVDNFVLTVEKWIKGKWEPDFIKTNLKVNHYSIQLNIKRNFRWKVEAKRGHIVLYRSVFRLCNYVGELPPTPQFWPVPYSPKKNKVFKNYPRKITFKWLHSTNSNYRRYQIQIDIYHPRPRMWKSEFKKGTFVRDQVTLKTSFHFNFPADRIGRWRVRGVKMGKKYTPWSEWRKFEFKALH